MLNGHSGGFEFREIDLNHVFAMVKYLPYTLDGEKMHDQTYTVYIYIKEAMVKK